MKTSYWSRLRVLTWAVLFAAGSLASCSDDDDKGGPTPPPVQLVDQIEYDGGTPIDIKSAIFEVEDTDLYTFYLSPTAGIADMDGMSEANDYLRVMVRNPKGTVNTDSDTFEISYKDISIKEATMKDVKSVKLSADYLSETSRLNLYVEVELESGKTLLARYENTCSKISDPLDELNNQYEFGGKKQTIDNAVKRIDTTNNSTTYYLYHSEDNIIGGPTVNDLTITLSQEATGTTFDLSTVDPESVSILCETFRNTANTTGTLTIEEQDGAVTVKIEATEGDQTLLASFSGSCSTYEGSNRMAVTRGETTEEAGVSRVFHYAGSPNVLTFGMVEAEEPTDLMQGSYAVSIDLAQLHNDEAIDLSAQTVKLRIFDYLEYRTWDNSTYEGVTGTLTAKVFGNKTYLHISADYPEGVKLESEWFGDLTQVQEQADLTPVEPYRPHITITTKDGSPTNVNWDITEMQLRHDPEYQDNGSGDKFAAYVFYFVNEQTESSGGIDNTNGTPVLVIPDGNTTYDVPDLKSADASFTWNILFNNSNLSSYIGYGYNNSWMKRCPEKGSIQVEKVDKEWTISVTLEDSIDKGFGGEPEGTYNTLVIEWKGPATKYTGTETNDLTDEDY